MRDDARLHSRIRARRSAWMSLVSLSILFLAFGCWRTGQHVLLSDEQLDRSIPPDLKIRPPTERELSAASKLETLSSLVRTDPSLRFPWYSDGLERYESELKPLLLASEFLPDQVETVCRIGPPAAVSDNASLVAFGTYDLLRVLSLRSQALALRGDGPGTWRSSRALARLIGTVARYRCASGLYNGDLMAGPTWALPALLKVVDTHLFTNNQLLELEKLLPTDQQLVDGQRGRAKFDFASSVIDQLRPRRVGEFLKDAKADADNRERYYAGRLNVPMTLSREVEASRIQIENIGLPVNRRLRLSTKALREQGQFLKSLPWPGKSDPGWLVSLRDSFFRFRERMEPNARGMWISGFPQNWQMDGWTLERICFAVAKAKLRAMAGRWDSMPVDPGNGLPVHTDQKRDIVWSVGLNGRDDGGAYNPRNLLTSPDYMLRVGSRTRIRLSAVIPEG